MSMEQKSTVMFSGGRIFFEANGWDGKKYLLVVHRFRAMEHDAIQIIETQDDEVLMADSHPVKVLSNPSQFFLEVDNLKMLRKDENGEVFLLRTREGTIEEEFKAEHREEWASYLERSLSMKPSQPTDIPMDRDATRRMIDLLRGPVPFGKESGGASK